MEKNKRDYINSNEITVIIPIFNTEPYLKECLDSVCNQTFKNMEIICVNDGSTDDSLNILYEYQKKDNRIKIINQENKGQGAARNIGLSHSNGKYVYFMDSDDFLEFYALEELYNLSEEKELDILLFKLINFNNNTYEKFKNNYYEMDFLNEN